MARAKPETEREFDLTCEPERDDPGGNENAGSKRAGGPPRLLAVGMMRPGAKIDSYRLLAAALEGITDMPWRLTIVGDGPGRPEVEAMFAFAPERVAFTGALAREDVFEQMRAADLFVWPGVREAFGVAYMEAQALGLPIVAFATAGVPVVVGDGETGLLAPPFDTDALRDALGRLLEDVGLRARMGASGRRRMAERHGIDAAARTIRAALAPLLAAATAPDISGAAS